MFQLSGLCCTCPGLIFSFRVLGFVLRASGGERIYVSGFDEGLRNYGSGCRVEGFGLRI